jgi:hypothetical protein
MLSSVGHYIGGFLLPPASQSSVPPCTVDDTAASGQADHSSQHTDRCMSEARCLSHGGCNFNNFGTCCTLQVIHLMQSVCAICACLVARDQVSAGGAKVVVCDLEALCITLDTIKH